MLDTNAIPCWKQQKTPPLRDLPITSFSHIHLNPALTSMPCQPYTHCLLETSLIHEVITCTQLTLTRESCQEGGAQLVMAKQADSTHHPSGNSHLTSHTPLANPLPFHATPWMTSSSHKAVLLGLLGYFSADFSGLVEHAD